MTVWGVERKMRHTDMTFNLQNFAHFRLRSVAQLLATFLIALKINGKLYVEFTITKTKMPQQNSVFISLWCSCDCRVECQLTAVVRSSIILEMVCGSMTSAVSAYSMLLCRPRIIEICSRCWVRMLRLENWWRRRKFGIFIKAANNELLKAIQLSIIRQCCVAQSWLRAHTHTQPDECIEYYIIY